MPKPEIGVTEPLQAAPTVAAVHSESTPRRTARRLNSSWTGSVLVIVIGTALAAWRLQSGFFVWNDDLYQFKIASEHGLSPELLYLNLFQHFAPINRLLHLAALDLFGLDPSGMAWISAALACALLCSVAWLATELRLSPLRRTLALILCAGSIVLVDTLAWMDGGWHGCTALIATYLVVAMHVRALRTGRQRWHLLSVLTFVVGLLTQERAAFALPMLVMVDLFLLDQQRPFRSRVGRLLKVKWPLVAMALAAVALAVLLRLEYVTQESGRPTLRLVGRTALAALTNQLIPQLVGFVPPAWPSAVQLVILVVMVLTAWWLTRMDRRNLGPILFLGTSFALYWGFLLVSPILNESNWVEQSQRYALYTLVPLALGLCSLHLGSGPRWWVGMAPGRRHRAASSAVLTIAIILCGTQLSYTAGPRWDPNRESHGYLQNVAETASTWSDPAVTVIPTQAPTTVAVDWATALGRGEFLLPLVAPQWQPGDLTSTVVSFDNTGTLQRTGLRVVAHGRPVDPPIYPNSTRSQGETSCLAPSDGEDGLRFSLDRPVDAAPALIKMTYSSTAAGAVTAVTLNSTSYHWADWPHPVSTGSHTTLLPMNTELINPADAVQLVKVPTGSTFCVQSVDIVVPVVMRSDGTCTSMDQYGRPTAPVQCPAG